MSSSSKKIRMCVRKESTYAVGAANISFISDQTGVFEKIQSFCYFVDSAEETLHR